jgi:hypothetical protein
MNLTIPCKTLIDKIKAKEILLNSEELQDMLSKFLLWRLPIGSEIAAIELRPEDDFFHVLVVNKDFDEVPEGKPYPPLKKTETIY